MMLALDIIVGQRRGKAQRDSTLPEWGADLSKPARATAGAMRDSRGFGRAIDYLAAQAAHRIAGQPRAQSVRPAPDFRGESRAPDSLRREPA